MVEDGTALSPGIDLPRGTTIPGIPLEMCVAPLACSTKKLCRLLHPRNITNSAKLVLRIYLVIVFSFVPLDVAQSNSLELKITAILRA